jgi:hypothetical protein
MALRCPICEGRATEVANPFCAMHAKLIYPAATLREQICDDCGHGMLTHDISPELLYSATVALPTDHSEGDLRFDFIRRAASLEKVDGAIVDIGGGPGELADQARRSLGKPIAYVLDFVDRVKADHLEFVPIDLNNETHRLPQLFADQRAATNLFMLSHVVEHLVDPSRLLRDLRAFTNSFVYIEAPDFGSRHGAESLKFSLNNLDHIHYFTDRSLLALAQGAGFRILAFETQTPPRMPAIRLLCAPRLGLNALGDYPGHFRTVAEQLANRIRDADAGQEIWVWGLSAYMAQALVDLGPERRRVSRILDTRHGRPGYLGLPVAAEPESAPPGGGASLLIVCGSTYSTVQEVIRGKAGALAPEAEFFALAFGAGSGQVAERRLEAAQPLLRSGE